MYVCMENDNVEWQQNWRFVSNVFVSTNTSAAGSMTSWITMIQRMAERRNRVAVSYTKDSSNF